MNILGEYIAFRLNFTFSLKRYLVWWLILLATSVFDYLTTIYFVTIYGTETEANLIIRWIIEHSNVATGALIGKLLQLLAVIIFVGLNRRFGNIFLLTIILLNCFAMVVNSI